MSKNFKQKLGAYISILYMLTKSFREKPTTYVSRVKKTKSDVKKMLFTRHPFVFFTQATKNVGFLRNLTCTHIMSRCMRQIFVWNFFTR